MKSLLVTSILFAGALAHPAHAAETIPYGSRIAMEVTVTDTSGLGTENAVIHVTHTRAMAKKFCVKYASDQSEKCVQDTLHEPGLKDVLTGNCKTGQFTTLYGEPMIFKGRNTSKDDGAPRYRIDGPNGTLDGSNASTYDQTLAQFKALCPARVDKVDCCMGYQ